MQHAIKVGYPDRKARDNWSYDELKDIASSIAIDNQWYQQALVATGSRKSVHARLSSAVADLTPAQKTAYFREGKCFICGKTGHKAADCPQASGTGKAAKAKTRKPGAKAKGKSKGRAATTTEQTPKRKKNKARAATATEDDKLSDALATIKKQKDTLASWKRHVTGLGGALTSLEQGSQAHGNDQDGAESAASSLTKKQRKHLKSLRSMID